MQRCSVSPAAAVCGAGTGLDPDGVRRKAKVIDRALAANGGRLDDPVDVLAALGGFEIAFLAGFALGCRSRTTRGRPRRVHRHGCGARRRSPGADCRRTWSLGTSHPSPDTGSGSARSGSALCSTSSSGSARARAPRLRCRSLRASLALLAEMATFDQAGVTDAGR